MAVYEYKLNGTYEFEKSDKHFKVPLSKENIEIIIDMWSTYKKGKYYNSPNIRLEDIVNRRGKTVMIISHTDFYSLLVSNIIRSQITDFGKYIMQKYQEDYYFFAIKELKEYYNSLPQCTSFKALMIEGQLANAMAVSVQIIDKYGNVLLGKRTKNVGIGQDIYSVSVTGAMDNNDWESSDPIKHCAQRELKEELNIEMGVENFEVVAIVVGVNKKQPIAIVNAVIDVEIEKFLSNMQAARDYEFEIKNTYICNISKLKRIVTSQKFTEAAEYHLKLLAGIK